MAAKNVSSRLGALFTLPSWYASRGEDVWEVRLLYSLRDNFWLLTCMFSYLLSLTLHAFKNGLIAMLCKNNLLLQASISSQGTTYT